MGIDWRTIQMFLSEDFVCEVQVDVDNHKKMRCSCPNFLRGGRCKHVRFVRNASDANNGHYSITVAGEDATEELVREAAKDSKSFRDFIIKYAVIEVL
jgi:predicted nucleic acid-binding Zn finger protein